MNKILSIIKKVLPWLIVVLIFAYLLREYKPAQLWKAISYSNVWLFCGLAIAYFSVLYIVDSLTMAKVLTRFGHPITTKEILPARGVTYLIMNINYPASQAAFAYYLKRTRGIPIFEVLGIFFFIAIVDLYAIMTLAFLGSFFQDAVVRGVDIGRFIQTVTLFAYAGLFVGLCFWRRWFSRITGYNKKIRFIEWFRSKKMFCVFNEATIKDYLKVLVIRSPIHISIVLFLYIAMIAFHAHVPIVATIANVPIAFLIGTIPITPGGLGTTNVALIELLHTYVTSPLIENGSITPQELIFAISIAWMCLNYALKSLVGVVWLQKVSGQLFKPTDNVKNEDVVSEATHLMGDL